MTNTEPEQAATQTWSASGYAANARYVADLALDVLALLSPRKGERILDLGCGDGALTRKIVEAKASVVAVDSSPQLLEEARKSRLDARLMNGHRLEFAGEFDAVFSNAALHWMREPESVIKGVRRALKPGGRFVGEFGGHGNIAAITTAIVCVLKGRGVDAMERFPWYFPSADEYAELLSRHGFSVEQIALIPRPTPLPTGLRGWLETFANPFLIGLDARTCQEILEEIESVLAPSLKDSRGRWTADYVRLRFLAISKNNR